jgi:hypothetical protein
MKTLVSVLTGRKDYPTFNTKDEDAILEYLKQNEWVSNKVFRDKGIEKDIVVEDGNDRDVFNIIDTELVNLEPPKEKGLYRVFARISGRCYLDVEASSEDEAMTIGVETDGGDFIDMEKGGGWQVESAEKLEFKTLTSS